MNIGVKQEHSDKIIFYKNVSVISLDIERNRIVFNFMNNIFVFGRWTPDYHYFSYNSQEEAINSYQEIRNSEYIQDNFFISEFNDHLVNKNALTTLSVKDTELKIIFNLNFSITSYKGNKPVEISKFVFWIYDNAIEYETERAKLLSFTTNNIKTIKGN